MIQKMMNFDDVMKENIKEHKPNWLQIHDPPHKILMTEGSGSGKTNSLFNLINQILIKVIYMLKIHMEQNMNF